MHPTLADTGDERVWDLIELLAEADTPQLLHDVLQQLSRVLGADEVALFAGHSPPVLISAHGRRVFAEQHSAVDRRLLHAVTARTTVRLHATDPAQGWRIDQRTVIRAGLWVPAPSDALTPAVVRVLRARPGAFPPGSTRLLGIVARRLAGALHRLQQQRFDRTRDAERTQLFLVSASVAGELDFEAVARRVVAGVTAVTDFATATVAVRHGTTVRRAATTGDTDGRVGVDSPLAGWDAALVDDRRVGELTYRVPLVDGVPADPGPTAQAGLITLLYNRDDEIAGFLTLSCARTGAEPSTDMIQTIELFARQTQIALVNAALHAETREQATRNAQLLELTTAMTATFEFDAIFSRIVEAVRSRMDASSVAVTRTGKGTMQVLGTTTGDVSRCPRPPLEVPLDDTVTAALAAAWRDGTIRLDDIRTHPALRRIARLETRGAIFALPHDRSETDVLLTVSSIRAGAFDRADERFLVDLAQVTKLAVRNAALFDDVRQAARRDPLTGLLNRRVFWDVLTARLDGVSSQRGIAVAVVDADDFKRVNDRFGHTVGDTALCHIAEKLRATTRPSDDVFRIGGEEFTVVMPGATAREAVAVMNCARQAISRGGDGLPPLSVSVGVAVAPHHGTAADAVFGGADRALLAAKRNGKDRVVLHVPER